MEDIVERDKIDKLRGVFLIYCFDVFKDALCHIAHLFAVVPQAAEITDESLRHRLPDFSYLRAKGIALLAAEFRSGKLIYRIVSTFLLFGLGYHLSHNITFGGVRLKLHLCPNPIGALTRNGFL